MVTFLGLLDPFEKGREAEAILTLAGGESISWNGRCKGDRLFKASAPKDNLLDIHKP